MRTILKRFRKRFILITLILVGVVSLIAFGSIGVMNQQSLKADIDEALTSAVATGPFGIDLPQLGQHNHTQSHGSDSIPVYCVSVDSAGNIFESQDSTAQMDSTVVKGAVAEALKSGATSGELTDYGLFYQVSQITSGYRIAFADTTSFHESMGRIALLLLAFWLVLMSAVSVITLFLSRYVTKPVMQAWEKQQRFVADASHELKTPLTVILADASILTSDPRKTVDDQMTWVEGISAEAARMQLLTEDMLTLASADAGVDITPMMVRFDLSQALERVLLQFEAVAFEHGMTISEEVEPEICIAGDPERMDRVFKTLLDNACKYGESSSTIEVTLKVQKNHAILNIHNAGEAIPPEDLPHIFERFYRSDKARVRDGESASFGLGLSIAKTTMDMHHGAITAASDETGTTFTLKLPLAK